MDRQVVKPGYTLRRAPGTEEPAPPRPGSGGDVYRDRLLKLIPAETVAVYLSLDGVLRSSLENQPGQLEIWLWTVFAVIAIANLLYLNQIQKVRAWPQHVIMTVAFVLWVLSIGGPFALYSWYQPFLGSVLTGLFTFVVPALYTGEETG